MPIRYAAPCEKCGSPYLEGSSTTCTRCLRSKSGPKRRYRTTQRLRCDCGKTAVAVILIRVGVREEELSELRLPVCRDCLEIEKETQAQLDRLGYSRD
ncbi:MAG: hypothetical protein ACWGO1_11595 [Anaerolineales bacterium]